MSKITFVFVCAQVLFIQAAYGQCLQSLNQGLLGFGGLNQVVSSCGNLVSSPVVSQLQIPSPGPVVPQGPLVSSGAVVSNNGGFGASGNGQLAVVGELPIAGNTFLEANLPVIGIVEFNGALPAGGYVTIVGNAPNDCGNYVVGNVGNVGNVGSNYAGNCGCY